MLEARAPAEPTGRAEHGAAATQRADRRDDATQYAVRRDDATRRAVRRDDATKRAVRRACAHAIRHNSRSFFWASRLLPPAVRGDALALYAFCRAADDAVDLRPQGAAAAACALRLRLDAIYRGRPGAAACDRALADVVARHALPRALPEALIEGFEWDAEQRRYADLDALHAYAARVAGSVGAMMAVLMGARSPQALARACDLGVAMQLTNIARDVGDDARNGRLYLPLDWLHAAGIGDVDAWLAAPRFDARLAEVVARLLAEAERLYRRADAGIGLLPPACRPAIRLARHLYHGIGARLAAQGLDSMARRTVVPPSAKARLAAHALLRAPWREAGAEARAARDAEPLAATRMLVEAARLAASAEGARAPGRVEWTLALFERLEAQDRARRAGPPRTAPWPSAA
jgi:phytoene synthase